MRARFDERMRPIKAMRTTPLITRCAAWCKHYTPFTDKVEISKVVIHLLKHNLHAEEVITVSTCLEASLLDRYKCGKYHSDRSQPQNPAKALNDGDFVGQTSHEALKQQRTRMLRYRFCSFVLAQRMVESSATLIPQLWTQLTENSCHSPYQSVTNFLCVNTEPKNQNLSTDTALSVDLDRWWVRNNMHIEQQWLSPNDWHAQLGASSCRCVAEILHLFNRLKDRSCAICI